MNVLATLKRRIRSLLLPNANLPVRIPHGAEGVKLVGHRKAVGGMWETIGKLQFDYLVSQGLQPHHVLCDIACGSLRAGIHFINYLDPGHYLGIEKEQSLIDAGVDIELGREAFEAKRPELVVSDSFEFNRFTRKPDFALAQSLFTHLVPEHIHLCLGNLRAFVEPGHKAYITFFEGDSARNIKQSHDHAGFHYSAEEMASFGDAHGFEPRYIGDWNHPRNQKMMLYTAI